MVAPDTKHPPAVAGQPASEASQVEGDVVYLVGAANSAGQAVLQLAKYAKQVVMIVRGAGKCFSSGYDLGGGDDGQSGDELSRLGQGAKPDGQRASEYRALSGF